MLASAVYDHFLLLSGAGLLVLPKNSEQLRKLSFNCSIDCAF